MQERLDDVEGMQKILTKAVHRAIKRHKLLGESIAVWRDGKVVILTGDEIPDFEEDTPPK
jgi:hypothetical protein